MTEKQRGVGGTNGITVKIGVDVSEALTGLKAVQREARKASQELRELETAYEEGGKRFYTKWKQSKDDECSDVQTVCLSDVPTKYLTRELGKRDGVVEYPIEAHAMRATTHFYGDDGFGYSVNVDGPACILVNKD
ncbi:hypothetical protein [Sporosarcina phage Lietuvens]|nr:hypothetical protein [Sporosarcina phage Lietuvens]